MAAEKWHPKQEGKLLEDGSYELKVPYSNDPELLMDILKYGADCQVVDPKELLEKVKKSEKECLAGEIDC